MFGVTEPTSFKISCSHRLGGNRYENIDNKKDYNLNMHSHRDGGNEIGDKHDKSFSKR